MQVFKGKIKKIGKCILFFLILIMILGVMSKFVTHAAKKDENLIQSRNKNIAGIQKEPENSIDVIVLGDSESYTSVSPVELWNNQRITSYICAQSGQKIQETYYMLSTALETQTPKLVLLETNVLFRSQEGMKGIQESLLQFINYHFPIFRFHDVWKPLFVGKQYAEENYKGFAIRDTVQSYDGGEYMLETDAKEKITGLVVDYMDKIISLCKEKGIPFMLYSAPSPSNYNYRKHNAIQDYCDKNSLEYMNLNLMANELGINWKTDSLDKGDHLNLAGANKVTKYLGEYIKTKYNLLGHHDDEISKRWQKENQVYTNKVEKKLELMKVKLKE